MSVIDKTDLAALIQTWTGLTAPAAATGTGYVAGVNICWAKDPQPQVSDNDATMVRLNLKGYKSNGVDDSIQSYNDTGDPSTSTISIQAYGNRDVTLGILVECYDSSTEAGEILDLIRTNLFTQAASDSLVAIGVAFQTCEGTVDLPTTYDTRVVNVASMDVHLSALAGFTWTSAPGTGWVDTVVPPAGTYT